MDYAAFFKKRLAQAYRAADQALRAADNPVAHSHTVTQLVQRLCSIEQDIKLERTGRVRRKSSTAALDALLKSIDSDLKAIGNAVYDKHLGHPDSPYVPVSNVALQITAKYL